MLLSLATDPCAKAGRAPRVLLVLSISDFDKNYTGHQFQNCIKNIFWNGPTIGFDFGGNLSKVFTLVYNLEVEDYKKILGRYPEAEGTLFLVAGLAVNYQKKDNVIIAPIRSGVGLRAGINIGYVKYTKKKSIIPF